MCIPNYITQNAPLEEVKFNKISNCNASPRALIHETDIFFSFTVNAGG